MREKLREWQGRYVFFVGRIMEWEPRGEKLWVCLRPVKVFLHEAHLTGTEMFEKGLKLDHLWVLWDLDKKIELQLERLREIQLHGVPYKYTRLDGSVDYAIEPIKFKDVSEAHELYDQAVQNNNIEVAKMCSELIINLWEKSGCPVGTMHQSTNEVIAIHKKQLRRIAKVEKIMDTRRFRRLANQEAKRVKKKKVKASGGFG